MNTMPQSIGNYTLDRLLGRGATGEVWLAHHRYLEQEPVAIKVLLQQDAETVQRFAREALLASQLHHPNIVSVYDHGPFPTDGPPGQLTCTIFEYVAGSTLGALLDTRGRLTLTDALAIFQQLAAALDYAHSLAIIHRDISPGNVMIEAASQRVLLTDFGIARDLNHAITVNYRVMGTPGYWSPEHLRSATEVTRLSDIYGLGALLYHMLSGQLPCDAAEAASPYRVFQPPPPLKQLGITGIPAEVDRVLQSLLAVDPAKRFPSAQAAADQLARIIDHHRAVTYIAAPDSNAGVVAQPGSLIDADPVEFALGPDLVRAPMEQARTRAESLQQPGVLADLLDAWAARRHFRLALLGRMLRLHELRSANYYFYRLRVLYEERSPPEASEEPDYHAQVFPLEPEPGLWQVALPAIQDFADEVGDPVTLPGATRVISCSSCGGLGKLTCPTCNGEQRIAITRTVGATDALTTDPAEHQSAYRLDTTADTPATGQRSHQPRTEQILVPCPDCDGTGGFPCDDCDGVGRLVQQKVFRWKRSVRSFAADDSDALPTIDRHWLQSQCAGQTVYCERARANDQATNGVAAPALRREWLEVGPLRDLLDEAQRAAGADTRIVLSEVTIDFIPISTVVFDLERPRARTPTPPPQPGAYQLVVYGFELTIPPDWRFLDWERVLLCCIAGFLAVLVIILGFFAFFM